MNDLVARARMIPLDYNAFRKAKRSGGERWIHEPNAALALLQRDILRSIINYLPSPPHAYGFVRGRNILENARLHLSREHVINIDLQEFFHSVTEERVRYVFSQASASKADAKILARAVTTEIPGLSGRRLPQGAPTSPALANHAARHMDIRLHGMARSLGCSYSRYADDLTFSGDSPPATIVAIASRIIVSEGYTVNPSKVHVQPAHRPQYVTGIRVDHNRLRPSQELLAAFAEAKRDPSVTPARLQGMLAHIQRIYQLERQSK